MYRRSHSLLVERLRAFPCTADSRRPASSLSMISPRPSIVSATMRASIGSRSHGRAPALRITASCTSAARSSLTPNGSDGLRHRHDAARSRSCSGRASRQRAPDPVDRDVVVLVQLDVARAAEHEQRESGRRRRAAAQHVADQRHLPDLVRLAAPLFGDQVVVHGARARVVDQVVDHHAAHAALEQRIALVVVRVEVADDQDVRGVVVDQRALGMLALGVRRVRQAFGDDVVAEGDAVRRAAAPFLRRLAGEARAGGRQVLVDRPGHRAVIDDHVVRALTSRTRRAPSRRASARRRSRCARGCAAAPRRAWRRRCRCGSA